MELGYDIKTAQKVLANLKDDIWINRLTRLVSLEFVAFEPGTNLFAYGRYNFECLPTGGIWTSYRIDPISFVGSINSSFSAIFIVCYVLIIIILLYSIYREFKEMRQLKSKYFKDIWNYIEWAFISFTITTIVLFFFKAEYTRYFLSILICKYNQCFSHRRGVWLGNPANIKVENNGAVGYVGSSPIVHNPLF